MLLLAPPVLAAEKAGSDVAQANLLYEAAGRFYAAGRYGEAAEGFRSAYALHRHPKYLRKLAGACLKARDVGGAIEALDRYVRRVKKSRRRTQAERKLKALRKKARRKMGRLTVTSTPEGATVRVIQKKLVAMGTTPFEWWLKKGRYRVAVALPGYADVKKDVKVRRKRSKALHVALARPGDEAGAEAAAGSTDVEAIIAAASLDEAVPEPDADASEDVVDELDELDDPIGAAETPDVGGDAARGGVWVAYGLAGAAILGGAVVGAMFVSARDDYEEALHPARREDFDPSRADELAATANQRGLTAEILIGTGVTAAVIGTVLLLSDLDDTGVGTPWVSAGGGGNAAGVGWRW